ncbi:MAG TPA: rod shape-determining protein MreD [Candidatus Binataceae bacterium]|nr:rod shape-determining protein MreD [Candidatus Binataceae bacterium]
MRLLLLFSLASFIALAIQTTLPRLLPLGILVPDLVLILAVDLGLRHHDALAALMAFGMGYAVDSFSGVELGLNALMLTLVFLFAYWLSRSLLSNSTSIGVLAVFLGVILSDIGNYVVSSGFAGPGRLSAMLPPVLIQAGITALLAPWVFGVMKRGTRMVGLRPHADGD